MNRQFFNAYKPALALLAGNVLLLAVLAGERQFHALHRERFAQELQQKHRTDGLFAALPGGEIALGSVDDYVDIVNRPLFIEGRMSVENVGEALQQPLAGNAASGEFGLSLSGVVLMPGSILALLTDKAGKHFRVRQGESIQGWEVESVQNDKIVMSNGTDRRELVLREFKALKKPPFSAGAHVPPTPAQSAAAAGNPPRERPQSPNAAPAAVQSDGGENSAEETLDAESSGAETADPETENQ
jgi:hypothetical protein